MIFYIVLLEALVLILSATLLFYFSNNTLHNPQLVSIYAISLNNWIALAKDNSVEDKLLLQSLSSIDTSSKNDILVKKLKGLKLHLEVECDHNISNSCRKHNSSKTCIRNNR